MKCLSFWFVIHHCFRCSCDKKQTEVARVGVLCSLMGKHLMEIVSFKRCHFAVLIERRIFFASSKMPSPAAALRDEKNEAMCTVWQKLIIRVKVLAETGRCDTGERMRIACK